MSGTLTRTFRALVLAASVAGLAACADEGNLSGGFELSSLKLPSIDTNLFGSDESERYPVEPDKFPIHVKAALAASVMRLRGVPAARVAQEVGVGGSALVSPEPGFDYGGFAVKHIELLDYETTNAQPASQRIAGFLHFEDGTVRHAAVSFDITYRTGSQTPLVMTQATVAPAFSPAAGASMFVVPARAVEAGIASAKVYADLYRLVVSSAVPMTEARTDPQAADYVIFVFFQDRLPNGDRVQAGISDVRGGLGIYTGATQYLAFKTGWVVAMVPGKFALGPDKPFWVKAVHTPAAGADGDAEPTLVGLFSSEPGTEPAS